MGEQFFGDLTNPFRNVTVSRKRALQLIGGVIPVAAHSRIAQADEAGKRHKPPLAFMAATATINAARATEFTWEIGGAAAHPASNYATTFLTNHAVASNLMTDKVRGDRSEAEDHRGGHSEDSRADRAQGPHRRHPALETPPRRQAQT